MKLNRLIAFSMGLVMVSMGMAHANPNDKEPAVVLHPFDSETFRKLPATQPDSVKSFLSSVSVCEEAIGQPPNCPRYYGSEGSPDAVVEVCQDSEKLKKGIYFILPEGAVDHREWYDPKFNAWACSERCNDNDPGGCQYKLTLDQKGHLEAVRFNYDINLSNGFYELKPEPEHKLQIINHEKTDQPS